MWTHRWMDDLGTEVVQCGECTDWCDFEERPTTKIPTSAVVPFELVDCLIA